MNGIHANPKDSCLLVDLAVELLKPLYRQLGHDGQGQG
jgi:hypothetical protein